VHALVTGAGGFLGRYIVEGLVRRGDRVRCLVRRPTPELSALGAELVPGDVRDAAVVLQACRDREIVFHTAAVAGIWGPWQHYYSINTVGTRNVVAACQRAGVPYLVYTSSPSVTFNGQDQAGVDESEPYASRWLCHYPHTKALAEQEVLSANGSGGLRTCALRPHLIWGPRDRHLIPRLIDRARRGRLIRVGDGRNRIDMIHVENAAAAHLRAAAALQERPEVGGRAYYLSQGEPVNCWGWINEILSLAGLPPVQRSISFRTARWLGALLEGLHTLFRLSSEPRMTRFLAAQLALSHYFDISRARRELGYQATISTAEGMDQLAAWLAAGER